MSLKGLYIHVPFCVRKCPYCDFYSTAAHDTELFDDYREAVLRNIKRYRQISSDLPFDTVYFGGGTPSLLPASFFESIISELSDGCLAEDAEITMELNPGTADAEKVRALRRAGINRLSVGIQSAVDSELKDLGRIHTFSQAADIIRYAYDAGFENISADLMTGTMHQTPDTLEYSVNALCDLPLKHISSYMLKIEEGTEYFRRNIYSDLPDEDRTAEMYLQTVRLLAQRGFAQYEISNFSKPGYESRHNLKYWHCEEYIGIGPSSHSYFNGKRYEVPRDLKAFVSDEFQNELINEEEPGDLFEKAMLGLRLTEGFDLSPYPEYQDEVFRRAEKYISHGLAVRNGSRLSLTPEGFLVSNSIISDILE